MNRGQRGPHTVVWAHIYGFGVARAVAMASDSEPEAAVYQERLASGIAGCDER